MKNKVITAFLIVVLGANLVGNIYQYIRMENATKEVAILTEQRDDLKERNESKEEQKNKQLSQLEDLQSQLEDLQTQLSELEKEKKTKTELLSQQQTEDKADKETEEVTEKQPENQTGKPSNKNTSDTSGKPTVKADNNIPPDDWTDGDSDESYPDENDPELYWDDSAPPAAPADIDVDPSAITGY